MRKAILLFACLVAAFSAAAQYPVRTVGHYSAVPAAELHFVDGNIGNYPIMRIGKELIRVDIGNDQSTRMPLTYVDSILFQGRMYPVFRQGRIPV